MSSRSAVRAACTELAAGQWGVLTIDQAVALGLSPSAVNRRLTAGEWVRVHEGVYRLRGYPTSWEQQVMAGCLWAGDGAVASHRAAARLHGLGLAWAPVELLIPHQKRPPQGIKVHRTDKLEAPDVTTARGIPATSVSRTLLDLGAVVPVTVVQWATEAALRQRLTSIWKLVALLDRLGGPGRRGTAALRQVLRERDPRLAPTESELENMLWSLISDANLPLPVRQLEIFDDEGLIGRVDFAYPDRKLVLEAQGARWHLMDHGRWHSDIERRTRLTLIGWRVVEISWKDIVRARSKLVRRIRSALESPAAA